MNAVTRGMNQQLGYSNVQLFSWTYVQNNLVIFSLFVALICSAFSIIYIRDLNRRLFSELQTISTTSDSQQVEWGQLLLEQRTLAAQSRVQTVAYNRLNMMVPSAQQITLVE